MGDLCVNCGMMSVTGEDRPFWGRLHFRGVQYRPNYFVIVYEDGDYQTGTTTAVKKILQPVDAQPPAGMVLPLLSSERIWSMMHVDPSERLPAFACLTEAFVPAAISEHDLHLLFSMVDLSQVAALSYPGSSIPQQLQMQMQQLGVQLRSAQTAAAATAAVVVSARPSSAVAAIRAAEQLKPAFLAVYQPGFQLTAELSSFLQRKQQQQQGDSWVGRGGVWFVLFFWRILGAAVAASSLS